MYLGFVDLQAAVIGRVDVVYRGTTAEGELADAVHAVVRIGAEHEGACLAEGEGLADELERACGVGCEDDGVAGWCAEE